MCLFPTHGNVMILTKTDKNTIQIFRINIVTAAFKFFYLGSNLKKITLLRNQNQFFIPV